VTSAGDRIGIIAGSGHLPLHVAHCLSGAGKNVYVAGLQDAADPALNRPEWEIDWYDAYSLQGLVDGLKQACVKKIVLAGRVGHSEIYDSREFDGLLISFMEKLKDHRPSTILGGLVDLLTANDFEVLPLTQVAPDLLHSAGRLAGPPVETRQIPDVELGWQVARIIADQDIGQAAVVKAGAVVAVEAMEGTDGAIERAGALSGGGITVVKLAAGHHDFRYDVPTVGPDTILNLNDAGGGLIAVEAGRSFVLELDKVSTLCDQKGITLLSCKETEDGGIFWPGT